MRRHRRRCARRRETCEHQQGEGRSHAGPPPEGAVADLQALGYGQVQRAVTRRGRAPLQPRPPPRPTHAGTPPHARAAAKAHRRHARVRAAAHAPQRRRRPATTTEGSPCSMACQADPRRRDGATRRRRHRRPTAAAGAACKPRLALHRPAEGQVHPECLSSQEGGAGLLGVHPGLEGRRSPPPRARERETVVPAVLVGEEVPRPGKHWAGAPPWLRRAREAAGLTVVLAKAAPAAQAHHWRPPPASLRFTLARAKVVPWV